MTVTDVTGTMRNQCEGGKGEKELKGMSVWELSKPKRVTCTKNGKIVVGMDKRVIRVKQGVMINDADEYETCKRNECEGASKMSLKRVREGPERESRS